MEVFGSFFALTQTISYGALIQSFTVLLVPMAHELNTSRTAITLAAAISTAIGALVAIPIGRTLDKYGGRGLMSAGSLIGVLAVLGWSQAGSLPELYIAFAFIGLG